MRFILLDRKKELVISAPTSSAANSISGNIVYTALGVNNRAKKTTRFKVVRNSYNTLA